MAERLARLLLGVSNHYTFHLEIRENKRHLMVPKYTRSSHALECPDLTLLLFCVAFTQIQGCTHSLSFYSSIQIIMLRSSCNHCARNNLTFRTQVSQSVFVHPHSFPFASTHPCMLTTHHACDIRLPDIVSTTPFGVVESYISFLASVNDGRLATPRHAGSSAQFAVEYYYGPPIHYC